MNTTSPRRSYVGAMNEAIRKRFWRTPGGPNIDQVLGYLRRRWPQTVHHLRVNRREDLPRSAWFVTLQEDGHTRGFYRNEIGFTSQPTPHLIRESGMKIKIISVRPPGITYPLYF